MNSKKTLLAASAIALLGIGSLTALTTSSAQAASNTSLVDRLVGRFGLNRDEVQTVFNENRAEHMAEHQQAMKDRLAQAVADGKITQVQANLITAKHTEMKTLMESLQDKSMEERHEAMEAKRGELKTWAEENNIPLQYLSQGMKGRHGAAGERMGMPSYRFGL